MRARLTFLLPMMSPMNVIRIGHDGHTRWSHQEHGAAGWRADRRLSEAPHAIRLPAPPMIDCLAGSVGDPLSQNGTTGCNGLPAPAIKQKPSLWPPLIDRLHGHAPHLERRSS